MIKLKVIIAAVNSKYVHVSLAPWYLKAACENITCINGKAMDVLEDTDIKVIEFTINQTPYEITRRIFRENPDVVAFSCYIFNISIVCEIINDLKKISNAKIIVGGPEVTYDAADFMNINPAVDFVISAEGEQCFKLLLDAMIKGNSYCGIEGLSWRENGKVINLPPSTIQDLDYLPSPYTSELLSEAKGKIIYFESSRGCPFSCSYCLSSTNTGVRYFSMDRVKNDLLLLFKSSAKQVKFVDRTFNGNLKRAKEIVSYIIKCAANDTENAGSKNYHFEAAADLFDDELTELLLSAPDGLFQLEIGIQSFNNKTLNAVIRKTDLSLCENNIRRLLSAGNIHIHLDLIAGLPYENFDSFKNSFNHVFAMQPHCIQLGFLKLLKGSRLRYEANNFGIVYSDRPPYEVLTTPWLNYNEILVLKDVETAVDILYNNIKFALSLKYIICKFNDSFNFFLKFSSLLLKKYPLGYGIPQKDLYGLILLFASTYLNDDEISVLSELLRFDFFVSCNTCNPPCELPRHEISNARELYNAETLPRGRVHYERFIINPLDFKNHGRILKQDVLIRFDYSSRNPVTGFYNTSLFRIL